MGWGRTMGLPVYADDRTAATFDVQVTRDRVLYDLDAVTHRSMCNTERAEQLQHLLMQYEALAYQ